METSGFKYEKTSEMFIFTSFRKHLKFLGLLSKKKTCKNEHLR